MLIEILSHTPGWVFGLFVLLLWLGGRQLAPSRIGLGRMALMPVAMGGLSFYGLLSAFGDGVAPMMAWAVAAPVAGTLVLSRRLPETVRYDSASRAVLQPGTPVPLMLMMGIFFTKYTVGVQLALHPELARQPAFVLPLSLLYGAFAGIFAARALRLWLRALEGRTRGIRLPVAAAE